MLVQSQKNLCRERKVRDGTKHFNPTAAHVSTNERSSILVQAIYSGMVVLWLNNRKTPVALRAI